MRKNVVIAGLIAWNLVLMAALLFFWKRSGDARAPQGADVQARPETEIEPVKQTVTLKAGDRFVGEKAPLIANRDITITATLDFQGEEGVIVAHGGLAHGYALYVQQTQLLFVVRRNNALTTVDGGLLKPGRHTVVATFARSGEMSVAVDGNRAGQGRAAGAITLEPVDGLDAGGDRGAPVGPYPTPNDFGGTIASVSVTSSARD